MEVITHQVVFTNWKLMNICHARLQKKTDRDDEPCLANGLYVGASAPTHKKESDQDVSLINNECRCSKYYFGFIFALLINPRLIAWRICPQTAPVIAQHGPPVRSHSNRPVYSKPTQRFTRPLHPVHLQSTSSDCFSHLSSFSQSDPKPLLPPSAEELSLCAAAEALASIEFPISLLSAKQRSRSCSAFVFQQYLFSN